MIAILVSVLVFFLVLFVLILVHEWGHFITAKKTGMRVDEFGIGFPPKLWGVRRGETEYTLNALPIGGFVRIYGEDPTQVEDDADKDRSFAARPRWAQAIVLVAGVVMNVLLAWLLFVVVFMLGIPTAVDESAAGPNAELRVVEIVSDSPLSGAVPVGAIITEFTTDDATLANPTPGTVSSFVSETGAQPITITYRAGDSTDTVTVTPQAGLVADDPERAAIGLRSALVETQSYGFGQAIVNATTQTWDALVLITTSIAGLIYNTAAGEADFSQIAGPIGIVSLVGDAAEVGIASLLMFTAIISLNLAVINLFPIPALDGGRLIFVAIESVIRRPIDPIWTARLNLIGMVFLLALMLAVTYKDILDLL